MATTTDEKLAAMIGDLAANFARFQIDYATQRGETKGDIRELGAEIKGDIREFEARFTGNMRELETRIKGDIREFRAEVNGTIQKLETKFEGTIQKLETKFEGEFRSVDGSSQKLETKLDGSIQKLETKFEGEFRSVEKEFKSLEKRVDRGFGFQKWLAGFLIPTTIGLIGSAVSLAFSAGHLDSSVRQLSARMEKLEQAFERISSVSRQSTLSPPALPLVAIPPERVFELRPKESMIGQINEILAGGNNPQVDQDVPFSVGNKLDAGKKPDWLTNGMAGLALLDGRLTADGIIKKISFNANYNDDGSAKNQVNYSLSFQIRRSELGKFKDKILSIDPAGNLPFSICFVRP